MKRILLLALLLPFASFGQNTLLVSQTSTFSINGSLYPLNSVVLSVYRDSGYVQLLGTAGNIVVSNRAISYYYVNGVQCSTLAQLRTFYSTYMTVSALARPTYRVATGQQDTLRASDYGNLVIYTNVTSVNCVVPAGLGAGFNCTIKQGAAGKVTFVAFGTTLGNYSSYTRTAGINAFAFINFSQTTDTYAVQGAME